MSVFNKLSEDSISRFGHPGRWSKAETLSAGTYYFTGSTQTNTGSDAAASYGVGGVMRVSTATGAVTMSAGGGVQVGDLTAGVVYEFSPREITVATGTVNVFWNRGGRE